MASMLLYIGTYLKNLEISADRISSWLFSIEEKHYFFFSCFLTANSLKKQDVFQNNPFGNISCQTKG